MAGLRHRDVEAEGIPVHVVEGGTSGGPALLFLHGWPESWAAFERVMLALSREAHVVAMDLPGIGGSRIPPPANDKRTLAACVRGVIGALGLRDVTLVGHDVGGMIVYAYLHAYRDELRRAVIMNVAIPGVEPWDEVRRNPRIWHFAFHAVPELPERLVSGREAAYFDFFFDAIAARPGAVGQPARQLSVEAYSTPEALRTGFEWYRALPQDEKDNRAVRGNAVSTPVLVLRGEREPGDLESYVGGLRASGLRDVRGHPIPDSGHFAPDEQPAEVVAALRAFMSRPAVAGGP
jgi:pimeloyl-ACP methyl ester carboxylesterase